MSSSRRRSMLRSYTNTDASIPSAMNAAFMPTTPPPMIITLAAATPGTPPSRIPRPPSGFSSMNAPAWVLGGGAPARRGRDLPPRLAHRPQQREPPAGVLDGLVGHAGGARLGQ